MRRFLILSVMLFTIVPLGLTQTVEPEKAVDWKLFVDSLGQVYTRADAPAYIFIAPQGDPESKMLVPSTDKGANPMRWDGSGPHYIVHKDAVRNINVRFRVLADGAAPRSSLGFQSGLIFYYNNTYFVESGATASVNAKDDMSGVESSFISINGEDFVKTISTNAFQGNTSYRVAVYSTDNVGNSEKPIEFTVNTTTEAAVQMENIYFDLNSAVIKNQSHDELAKLVAILKQFPNVYLEIRAHTDSNGSASYNLALSEHRAQSTVDFLVARGIAKSRLKAKGYGDTMLLNECSKGVQCPDSKHRQNRRVEFVITKVDGN